MILSQRKEIKLHVVLSCGSVALGVYCTTFAPKHRVEEPFRLMIT